MNNVKADLHKIGLNPPSLWMFEIPLPVVCMSLPFLSSGGTSSSTRTLTRIILKLKIETVKIAVKTT